jgi:hypothetical protein
LSGPAVGWHRAGNIPQSNQASHEVATTRMALQVEALEVIAIGLTAKLANSIGRSNTLHKNLCPGRHRGRAQHRRRTTHGPPQDARRDQTGGFSNNSIAQQRINFEDAALSELTGRGCVLSQSARAAAVGSIPDIAPPCGFIAMTVKFSVTARRPPPRGARCIWRSPTANSRKGRGVESACILHNRQSNWSKGVPPRKPQLRCRVTSRSRRPKV